MLHCLTYLAILYFSVHTVYVYKLLSALMAYEKHACSVFEDTSLKLWKALFPTSLVPWQTRLMNYQQRSVRNQVLKWLLTLILRPLFKLLPVESIARHNDCLTHIWREGKRKAQTQHNHTLFRWPPWKKPKPGNKMILKTSILCLLNMLVFLHL